MWSRASSERMRARDAADTGAGAFARDGVELQAPSWASAEALSASATHRRAAALARAETSVTGL